VASSVSPGGVAPACQRQFRRLRELGGTGGPAQRRRAAGPGRSRRELMRIRRRGIRVPAWSNSMLTPASAATSPRRKPGTRRLPTSGRPACCGVSLALREMRNSRTSARLSIPMTVPTRLGRLRCPGSTPFDRDSLSIWCGVSLTAKKLRANASPESIQGCHLPAVF
jgi:hypothetical protein